MNDMKLNVENLVWSYTTNNGTKVSKHKPSSILKKWVQKYGNGDLDVELPKQFLPEISFLGYKYKIHCQIAIKAKNIHPHSDYFLGHWDDEPVPENQLACFWFLDTKLNYPGSVYFGIEGDDPISLYDGYYVVFNDSKKHWLMADYTWTGIAFQLTLNKNKE